MRDQSNNKRGIDHWERLQYLRWEIVIASSINEGVKQVDLR